MKVTELKEAFTAVFSNKTDTAFFSPGRINLINEHADYNGGHVLPAAITPRTYGAARKRDGQTLCFYSANFTDLGIIEVGLANLAFDRKDSWTNYPKGVIKSLQKAGHTINTGSDLYVNEDIPSGSGLSSSISSESLIGIVAKELFGLSLDCLDLIKVGKQAENEFIGVNSGVMDQLATGMEADKQTIYLDTNMLEYNLVPLDLGDNVIVIMDTNKRRELADSKYNEYRAECGKAAEELNQVLDIKTLGELDLQAFDEYSYLIRGANRLKRTRHAVWGNQHAPQAKGALIASELKKFGRLINASHVSLEHDYEVTGIELNTSAHTTWQQEGVLGARIAGAGFGGCGITIVAKDKVDEFTQNVGKVCIEIIGYAPVFYIAEIAGDSRVLSRK